MLIVLAMLLGSATSASAQVRVGIGLPSIHIGIDLPLFPELVRVPSYPVYYAPRVDSNYFFYDGMYWVYEDDSWYASDWYNGPWSFVDPELVPLFVLRIPVRYYRNPPPYFHGWRSNAPPRWGERWGHEWEQHRGGWDRWSRASAPRPAPLPVYQRRYAGDRYPRAEEQPALHRHEYRYQPREAMVRQHYREQAAEGAPSPSARIHQGVPEERGRRQQERERSNPLPPIHDRAPTAHRGRSPQPGAEAPQRSAPMQAPPRQRGDADPDLRGQPRQRAVEREQRAPRTRQEAIQQGGDGAHESGRGRGQGKDHAKDTERGRGHDR